MGRILVVLSVCGFCATAIGCSAEQRQAGATKSANVSLGDGLKSLEEGQYEAAIEQLTDAIEQQGLNADQIETAYFGRAKAYQETQKFSEARHDLDFLLQNAGDVANVHVAISELQLKQGDAEGAKASYASAKKLNPKAAAPAGLK
jgi:Tfp pilus assembly protein PilF